MARKPAPFFAFLCVSNNKVDGQTGAKLQGAEFSIYKDNVEYVGSYTTDPNGGIKTWNDNNDAAGARPSSIKLHLFANGNVIVYTLSEDEVSGYNTEISEPVTAVWRSEKHFERYVTCCL